MDCPSRDSTATSRQKPVPNVDSVIPEKQNSDGVGQHASSEKTGGSSPQGDPQSNASTIPQTTDDEPDETEQYATPRELSLLSTVFTIATFMIAIDGSILGKKRSLVPYSPYLKCHGSSLGVFLL